ncbi:MAG: hypothetical protein QOF78_3036 [Phycisphaerales bacterium]|nr:hypothetical protein [Phycisphaerales bacterium]
MCRRGDEARGHHHPAAQRREIRGRTIGGAKRKSEPGGAGDQIVAGTGIGCSCGVRIRRTRYANASSNMTYGANIANPSVPVRKTSGRKAIGLGFCGKRIRREM